MDMDNFKMQMYVAETKGLLELLKRRVSDTKYNLAIDNIRMIGLQTKEMRQIIDRIENKIKECPVIENDDDMF